MAGGSDKHNRHHAHPNTEDADPDIADRRAGVHCRAGARQPGAWPGWSYRYQAYLFFPLLLLEAINLHVASIRALTSRASR